MKRNPKEQMEQVDFNVIDTFGRISDAIEDAGDLYFSYFNPDYGYIEKSNKGRKKNSMAFGEDFEEEHENARSVSEEAVANIRKMAAYLGVSEELTIVFMALYAVGLLHNLYADKQRVASYLSVGVSRILFVQNCIDELERKGLVERREGNKRRCDYEVNAMVEDAIRRNLPLSTVKKTEFDIFKFCRRVEGLVRDRDFDCIDTHTLFEEVKDLEERYPDIPFLKEVASKLKQIDDRVLLYIMANAFSSSGRGVLANGLLNAIYDNAQKRLRQAKKMMDNSHVLLTKGYASLDQGGHFNDARLNLSAGLKKKLLGNDYTIFLEENQKQEILLKAENIKAKELFFDGQTQKSLQLLTSSLQDTQFKSLQQRLKSRALPMGVAALLYGAPGTGKTETVLQLAKQTGRSVLQVDIASCRSKWYGETQQLVKGVFDNYRAISKDQALKPILFFNEADALFGKRREVEGNNSSVLETENSIQNIILEEMEHLDGILIATTNMMNNFDSAFSRRFLFKIKFDLPTLEAKKSIWKSKLDWLTDEQAERLASKFALSGGEIDNIVRKSLMEEVLNAQRPDMEALEAWCKEEHPNSGSGAAKIGFAC